MWEFYLGISEQSFRYRGHMVFQIQLAKTVDAAADHPRLHRRGRARGEPAGERVA